jgi:dihydrofolate reductase
MSITLALIVARARNGVIGAGGKLPWRLRSDLQHFKRVTMGHPVIMGRKTWESLPIKPLPGRLNIVLSQNGELTCKGAVVVPTLDEALELATEQAEDDAFDRVFVIGGDAIYRLALPQAAEVILSEVDADVAGDAHFPDLDPAAWTEVSAERIEAGEGDDHPFTIRTLRRVSTRSRV